MRLSEICINRPVLSTVICLVLILLGFMGYRQLELRAAPKHFSPHLNVIVNAAGSSAEFIEKNAVTPLEERLQDVSNLSFINSESDQDYGRISLQFGNVTQEQFISAETQVLQIISQVNMPQSVQSVKMRQGNSSTQLMFAAVSSTAMSQHILSDYVKNTLIKQLSQVPGIGKIYQHSTDNALRVSLYPEKMAQYKLAPQAIIDAINQNNLAKPAGQIFNLQQTIPVNLKGKLDSISAFQNLIVAKVNKHYVRLKEIAHVAIDHQSYAGAFTYYNGKQGIGLGIFATDQANPIKTGRLLEQKILELNRNMPVGTKITVMFNGGRLIRSSVNEVLWTIIESIALVALVTFLFLGRLRFALIPIVTIPVCIITTFSVMWFLGFSLNLISLLALVLGVGLVVDDAIVVLENCHRHIEKGESPKKAALVSLKEISFPVIAMTVSLFAVYLPSAFLKGKAATYIQQFAFTLAGAVIVSGFVALTLTPMMCSRLLTRVDAKGYDKFLLLFFQKLQSFYKRVLSWVLSHRPLTVVVFVLLLVLGVFIFRALPSTLIPNEYSGYLFAGIKAPDSASVAYVQTFEKPFLKRLLTDPKVSEAMSFGGGNGNDASYAANFIRLSSAYRSYANTVNEANKLENQFSHSTAARVTVTPMNLAIGGDDGADNQTQGTLVFYIVGNASYSELSAGIEHLASKLKKSGLFEAVDNGVKLDSQQYQISINRDLAARLNVSIGEITSAISTFLGGYYITDGYQFKGVNYPVILQLPAPLLKDLHALNGVFVSSNLGLQIPITRLIHVKSELNLSARFHMDTIRAGRIVVTAKPNVTTGQIVKTLQSAAKSTLPSNLALMYTNQIRHLLAGNDTMSLLFILGLLFIYLVLAALYESFIDPFIILLTVPLCVVGAMVILYLIGGSLNLYTGVGLITLIGLVSKHGVLIVQFANDLLATGSSKASAVLTAATIRLRPILMTTATMAIGAVPLLFFSSIGSNSRIQLATVIIAGLLFGTFFSLFVVPVAYTIFKRVR